jgi:quercetin dioxygenase-like cupin family protein
MTTKTSNTVLTTLLAQRPPFVPLGADVMIVRLDLPPGDPGSPPHRHSGPVFGYMLEGEMIFELEGEPERVIRAGETFWEPGGDVIHYQAANNTDRPKISAGDRDFGNKDIFGILSGGIVNWDETPSGTRSMCPVSTPWISGILYVNNLAWQSTPSRGRLP